MVCSDRGGAFVGKVVLRVRGCIERCRVKG